MPVEAQMPRFVFKPTGAVVWALPIASIEFVEDGHANIAPDQDGFDVFKTRHPFRALYRGDERDLGFYVQHRGGTEEWVSNQVFYDLFIAEKYWTQAEAAIATKSFEIKASGLASWEMRPLMDFGGAIRSMKAGRAVARRGWNGKGMWIALSPGSDMLEPEKFWSPAARAYASMHGGARVLPAIIMKNARGEIVMGWLASQEDMLAADWVEVDVAGAAAFIMGEDR